VHGRVEMKSGRMELGIDEERKRNELDDDDDDDGDDDGVLCLRFCVCSRGRRLRLMYQTVYSS